MTRGAIVVIDASVLLNFLSIDRMDLLARHSGTFIVTDHVAAEVGDRYPGQRQRFASAVAAGAVLQETVTSPEELSLFGSLAASGRLGAGECSAIAVAVHRRLVLAIDDRQERLRLGAGNAPIADLLRRWAFGRRRSSSPTRCQVCFCGIRASARRSW